MSESRSVAGVLLETLVKRTSPDMLCLFQFSKEIMEDPKQTGLIKFGAFLAGSFACGQIASDFRSQADGKPRQWICGPTEPPREEIIKGIQQALLFKLPPTKNIFGLPPAPATSKPLVNQSGKEKRAKRRSRSRSKIRNGPTRSFGDIDSPGGK